MGIDTKKILLVEDSPDDIELVQMAMRSKRLVNKMDIVMDGEEALDYLFCRGKFADRDPSVLPVFVLLDLQLPKIDGFEVLREIRANKKTQRIPVIIFTSSGHIEDVKKGYSLGANSYIRKPVDSDDFEKAIEELNMYWMILNELPR